MGKTDRDVNKTDRFTIQNILTVFFHLMSCETHLQQQQSLLLGPFPGGADSFSLKETKTNHINTGHKDSRKVLLQYDFCLL